MSKAPERIWAFAPDIFDNCSLWQDMPSPAGDTIEYVRADRIEELEDKLDWVLVERDETFALMLDRAQTAEAKLAKALAALGDVQRFVKDLAPYADQGHTLVPALQRACATYMELKGETND